MTCDVFKNRTHFVESVFLAVLVSIAHQRLADTLALDIKTQTPCMTALYLCLMKCWPEFFFLNSNQIDSETYLHTRPLEGSFLLFHKTWSLSALRRRESLQTEHRLTWPGFLSVQYQNITQRYKCQ